jgi:serine/threonine protein kinase
MRFGLASVRDDCGFERVARAVRTLEDEWNHGEPRLEQSWVEQDSSGSVSVLAALVKADLRCRYARGQRPSVADYLEHFPVLRSQDDRVLSLIYEEFCLREEQGEHPDAEQFCERYASWSDSLASQLRYHQMLSRVAAPSSPPPRFPEPGEHFEEYKLDRILGKGGAAQVYKAYDESLGGRPVALKISSDRGHEHLIQGPLDHAHIVAVHSVVYQPETQLCGLCMPFRPGLPLDEVIKRVNPASAPRTARALWEAVAEPGITPAEVPSDDQRPAWEGYSTRGTYADGVAWVVVALARALAYAHAQGIPNKPVVLHRDVKPANVLMTYRDGPQLLDFNLAYDPHSANQAVAAMRGGTLPYMAPEQLEAFLDPQRWDDVDARADLYSLGLVMCEMLTGRPPDAPSPNLPPPRAIRELLDRRIDFRVALRRFNPRIPQALEAITARCLAAAPADRYPDASALADDLQRFLERRPLEHVVNPSRRERTGNWLWRNRRVLAPAASLLLIASLVFISQILWRMVPIERRSEFLAAVDDIDHAHYREAIRPLESLIKEKPNSPLARAYLSIALDQTHDFEGAETHFTQAVRSPSAEEALATWGRDHRNLTRHLVSLGKSLHDGREHPRPGLAHHAYLIAERIDPGDVKARQGAATLDAVSAGKYLAAQTRWDALIQQFQPGESPEDRTSLAVSYLGRAQNSVLWARKWIDRDPAQSRMLLQKALEDCERGSDLLNEHDLSRHFSCDLIQAEALIELGDLEDRAQKSDAAADAYRKARTILDQIGPPLPGAASELKALGTRLPERLRGNGHSSPQPATPSPPQ